jgi:hypothetical protein
MVRVVKSGDCGGLKKWGEGRHGMQTGFCWRKILDMPTSNIKKEFGDEHQDGSKCLWILRFEVEETCAFHGELWY